MNAKTSGVNRRLQFFKITFNFSIFLNFKFHLIIIIFEKKSCVRKEREPECE